MGSFGLLLLSKEALNWQVPVKNESVDAGFEPRPSDSRANQLTSTKAALCYSQTAKFLSYKIEPYDFRWEKYV